MLLSYVLAFVEYWPHLACKYTSIFTHNSITNLKVLTFFYDSCVCGLSCDCGLNYKTAIRRNATAPMVESMCYISRKIALPDLGIASSRVAINFHSTTTICYSMHTAVQNSSFSKLLALLQSFSSRITLKAEKGVQLAGKGEM